MKLRLSSLDIRALTNELDTRLTNKYVQNFYSTQQRFMYIKFSNKDILLIEPGFTMHLSATHDTEISHFCKKLREKCRHTRVRRIYQQGFDRVIIIDLQRFKIIVEIFSGGNILIIDEDDTIIDLLRPVTNLGIVKNTKYIWNPVTLNLTFDQFLNVSISTMLPFEKEFVDFVTGELEHNFGPIDSLKDEKYRDQISKYFKELEIRIESLGGFAEVTVKKGKPDQLLAFPTEQDAILLQPPSDPAEISKISNLSVENVTVGDPVEISKISNLSVENVTVDEKIDVGNLDNSEKTTEDEICSKEYKVHHWDRNDIAEILKKNKQCKALHFNMFNEAIEYCFSDRKKVIKVKMDKTERISCAQQAYINELEKQAEVYENTAQGLESNRDFVSEILNIFNKVYENKIKWEMFEQFWESECIEGNLYSLAIKNFNLKEKTAIIDIDESLIELKLGQSVNASIDEYYIKRKKALDKAIKTKNAMENIVAKMTPKKMVVKAQKRVGYWFEKYNFFFSSENDLVIGGKNAQENEGVVKTHLEKNDLYFHCDVHGGSSVICKARTEATINEASYMALCYSKCWDEGVVRPVFYVEPEQVSKVAPSGEYLSKGGFFITGKKTFLNPYKLEYGLGLIFKEEGSEPLKFEFSPSGQPIIHAMPLCAPWLVIKNYKYRLRLCPGNEKKSQIAQTALKTFNAQSEGSPEEAFVRAISMDEYINIILGKSKVAKIIK